MAGKSKEIPCIPGKGCAAVIEITGTLQEFMGKMQQSMTSHSEISGEFWLKQQASVDDIVEKMNTARVMFNDGAHRMKKTEEDIDSLATTQREDAARLEDEIKFSIEKHESEKYGPHADIKTELKYHRWGLYAIAICGIVFACFVGTAHQGFFDYVREFIVSRIKG